MCKSRLNSDYPYLQPDNYTHTHACMATHAGKTKVCFPKHTHVLDLRGFEDYHLRLKINLFGAAEVDVTITSGFWTCVIANSGPDHNSTKIKASARGLHDAVVTSQDVQRHTASGGLQWCMVLSWVQSCQLGGTSLHEESRLAYRPSQRQHGTAS